MPSAVKLLQASAYPIMLRGSIPDRSHLSPLFSQLFSVFSRRKILCASGNNHRYLLLILETINNIIQYQ